MTIPNATEAATQSVSDHPTHMRTSRAHPQLKDPEPQHARSSLCFRIAGSFALCIAMFWGQLASAQGAPLPERAKRVYVPIEDFQAILNRDREGVLLPKQEFEALWKQAVDNQIDSSPGPNGLVVSSASYETAVEDRQLLITAKIEFHQYLAGWRSFPLLFRNLGVESASLGDQPARLGRDEQGNLRLFHNQTGRHVLELKLSTPLGAVGSDQVAAFTVLAGPPSELSVNVPAQKHLLFQELSLERPAPIDQPATYSLPVGGSANIRLRMTQKQTEKLTDSLVFANTLIGVDAAPGEITWQSMTQLQVFGAKFNQLVLNVPISLEVADVQSSGLEAWELAEDPDDEEWTRITLNYRQPISGSRTVRLRGVMPMPPEEQWTIPQLRVSNATSHVGRLILTHPPGVRIQILDQTGLRRSSEYQTLDPKQAFLVQFPDRSSPQVFEFWQDDFSLELVMRSRDRELIANIQNLIDIQYETLRYVGEVKLACRYAPLFEFDMELPAEWVPISLTHNGQNVEWQDVGEEAGTRRLRVTLAQPLLPGGELTARLEAVFEPANWPPEGEAAEVDLAQIKLPQVSLFDGQYFLTADPDFELKPLDLSGLNQVGANSQGSRIAYEYQDTEISGTFSISRRPTTLSAQTLSFVRIDPGAVRSHLEALIDINGSGVRRIKVSLPESTGTNLRFLPVGTQARLIEQTPAAPANGRIEWMLAFDRRVRGTVGLAVDITQTRADDATSFTAPELNVTDANRQNGVVAIEAGPEQNLSLEATSVNQVALREIDAVEIGVSSSGYVPQERIIAAYRYIRPGYTVTLAEERFDRSAVPSAVCHSMSIRSLIGKSGRWQHEATIEFSAVGVQSLLVTLPNGASLWASLLDSEPIEVRKLGEDFLVPLDAGGATSRVLRLFYHNLSEPLANFGKLQQIPPRVSVEIEGETLALEVLDNHWEVFTPDHLQVVDSKGIFRGPDRDVKVGWLAGLADSFRRIGGNQIISVLLFAAIAFVVLFFLDRLLRKTKDSRPKEKSTKTGKVLLGISLLFLVVCVLVLFWGSSAQQQFNSAFYEMSSPSSTASRADIDFEAGTGESVRLDMADESGAEDDKRDRFEKSEIKEFSQQLEETDSLKGVLDAERQAATKDTPPPTEVPAPATPSPNPDQPADPFGEVPQRVELERSREALILATDDSKSMENLSELMSTTPLGSARLSVDVNFQIPDGHRSQEYRYYGTTSNFESVPLDLRYLDENISSTLTLLVIAITLLFFYLIRHREMLTRLLCNVLGLAVPLALAGWNWRLVSFVLDGIFIGSLIAALVWGMLCFCKCVCIPLCQKYCRCCFKTSTTAAILLMLSSSIVSAQPQQAAPNQEPNQAAQAESSPQPPIVQKPDWTVIVPYDPAADPFAADKVFLNQQQFVELWNRAHPDQPLAQPAGPKAYLAGASFVAELEQPADSDASLKVTARFVLHLLKDGTHSIALPLQKVAMESASLDGKPAALTAGSQLVEPAYRVSVEGAGIHLLDVTFRLPVELAGEAGQFTLPLSVSVPGTLTFRLPAEKLNVRVNGTTTAYRKLVTEGQESVVVPLGETAPLAVSWNPPSMGAGVDRVIHVETVSKVSTSDAGLALSSQFQYRIRQGSVEEFLYELPAGWNLQSIAGPDVGGWQIEGNENQRLIRVFLRRAIEETTQVTFEMFRAAKVEDDMLDEQYPHLVPQEITRETGYLGLFSTPHLTVRATAPDNASRVENNVYPGGTEDKASGTTLQLAYRFSRPDYALSFSVERKAPEAKATSNHGLIVGESRARLASKYVVELGETPRSRLSFLLPETYVILDVQASTLEDWYQAESADGDLLLILDFPAPVAGTVQVALNGYLRKEPLDEIAEIFVPTLLEMTEDKTTLAVWTSGNYRLSTDELDGWKAMNVAQVPAEVRSLQNRTVDLAYEGIRADSRYLSLLIERIRPVLTADSVTILNLTDTAIVYQLAFKWSISRAATNRFVFTTPDSFAGKLDFTGAPHLRNYSSELLDDGRVRWTVFLSQPQAESYFLSPLVILPPPENGDLAIPRLQVESFEPDENGAETVVPLARQRHFAVLVNQSNAQLSVNDAALLEPISLEDLPLNTNRTLAQQATDIFRLRPERALPSWTLKSFQQKRGAAAVVNFAKLTTVVEDDGGWRMHASYLIRNRGRQFLGLKIPAGARLLSAAVEEQPVRPVKTSIGAEDAKIEVTLLPLPKGGEEDTSFFAEIILAGRLSTGQLARGLSLIDDDFDLPAPKVVSMSESAALGIPVSRTSWNVYLPEYLSVEEVDDIDRTNLSPQPSVEAELDLQIVQLEETNAVLSRLTETENQNLAIQYNAAANARELERDLREKLSGNESSFRSNPKYQKLQEEQRKLGENIAGQGGFLRKQQEAQQSGNVEYFYDNFSTLDSRSQLGLTIQGNRFLYDFNSSGLSTPASPEDGTPAADAFNFNVPVESKPQSEPEGKSAGQSAVRSGSSISGKKRLSNSANQEFLGREQMNAPAQQRGESQPMEGQPQGQMSGRAFGVDGLARPGEYGGQMGGQGGGGFGGGGAYGNSFSRQFVPPGGVPGMAGPGAGIMPMLQAPSGGELPPEEGESTTSDWEKQQSLMLWKSTRGMSLTFELPTAGTLYTFSKAGGDPRLALEVQPADSWTLGFRVLWFAIWAGLALLAVRLVKSGKFEQLSGEQLSLGTILLGLLVALLIPAIGPAPGLLIATGGGIAWLVCRYRHHTPAQPEETPEQTSSSA